MRAVFSTREVNSDGSMPVPEKMVGSKFLDVFIAMKTESNATVLGVQKGSNGEFISNPDVDYLICEKDNLLVISKDRDNS